MTTTEQRLIQAAIDQLIAVGYQGATTRSISERAGVNEVTLFRRFGSKDELLAAAISQVIAPFVGSVADLTGELHRDLELVARSYVGFVDANQGLMMRLIASAGDQSLGNLISKFQGEIVAALRDMVIEHQGRGELVAGQPEDLLREFMGPLAVRPIMSHLLEPGPFDAAAYVGRYLDGHGASPAHYS